MLYLSVLRSEGRADTRRRRARDLGAFSPHDWIVLDRCIKTVARATANAQSEAVAAGSIRVDVKTLSSWCGRLFGLGWKSLLAIGCWESVMERALRYAGYTVAK